MTDALDPALDFEQVAKQVAALDDPVELMEQAYVALTQLLRRAEDSQLLDQLSIMLGEVIGDLPFEAPEQDLRRHTRFAAGRCVELLEAARDRRLPRIEAPRPPHHEPAPGPKPTHPPKAEPRHAPEPEAENAPAPMVDDTDRPRDLEYRLPPHLEHLLKHIEYQQPSPPPPQGGFTSFDQLCLAALNHRIDSVLTFFHKHNTAVVRPLPPLFLLSPDFAERFKAAVATLIFPKIKSSRQLRLLATNIDVASATTETFWLSINSSMSHMLQLTWNTAWNDLRLIPELRGEEKVLKVKPETKELRALLTPSAADAYDLPHIGNHEIELFKSLMSATIDWWPQLSEFWWVCHTLYEQEWDPRIFQQQAREGALRDSLLRNFEAFPEPWHDFFVLMLHRVFPRITTRVMERFAYNLGQNEETRRQRMPYLMHAISQAKAHPEIRRQEHLDESHWREQVKALADYLKGVAPEDN